MNGCFVSEKVNVLIQIKKDRPKIAEYLYIQTIFKAL